MVFFRRGFVCVAFALFFVVSLRHVQCLLVGPFSPMSPSRSRWRGDGLVVVRLYGVSKKQGSLLGGKEAVLRTKEEEARFRLLSRIFSWPAVLCALLLTVALEWSLPSSPFAAPSSTGSSSSPEAAREAVEEIWDTLNKYYYDSDALSRESWVSARLDLGMQAFRDPRSVRDVESRTLRTLRADKYTRFLDAKAYEAISKYDVLGVGLILTPEGDYAKVLSPPLPKSSADGARIKKGDLIRAIDDKALKGLSSFQYLDIVQDKEDIMLTFDDGRQVLLKRATSTEDAVAKTLITGDVGYLRLKNFNARAPKALADGLSNLRQRGAKAFVIDLRGNPGGAFQAAIDASALFLRPGSIVVNVIEKSNDALITANNNHQGSDELGEKGSDKSGVKGGSSSVFRTSSKVGGEKKEQQDDLPVEIWIDRGSASSSEVFAGALRDNCRAVLAGNDKSYGKGKIQGVFGLKDGGGLVITVAQYLTPDGTPIQGRGLTPDIPLPPKKKKNMQALPLPDLATLETDFYQTTTLCKDKE